MSVAAHHAEWLSLVPASGPFLSLPVALETFPQGLDAPDTDFCAQMRVAHQEWIAQSGAPAYRRAWFEFVRRGLGYPSDYWRENQEVPAALRLELPQYGETLRPDAVLMAPDVAGGEPSEPRLLWQAYLPAQGLEKTYPTRGWNASPATRMAELLRATGVALGLVSNGEDWMLIHAAPGQATSYVNWNAMLWNEERVTWRAFVSLLGAQRFFAGDEEGRLERLFERSLENQQEVTDQLGLQVRRALELLVSTFEREDQNTGGYLLRERTPREIYEAALCVMMRLVFLFCAEERGMLPLENPFYARNYAVSTLRAELRERADEWSEETLERGFDAWCRLLSTFRVVYGGIEHEECPLIPYGGGLFDPNKFAWLEGRDAGSDWEHTLAEPLPVDNRTVLHLLEALQILRTNVPGIGLTARVVSFRALDIEQIGHVYEGLLDHTARRASTAMVSLRGNGGQEPEIALETLEQWRDEGTLVTQVAKQTGRGKGAIEKDMAAGALALVGRLHRVCGEESLVMRVLPFANLIRIDAFDLPVVIRAGALFVTREGDRRATGTHYTPRSLTEPLVAKTLDPLLYRGTADGVAASRETLLSAREILELKVCDPACGSGGVLVQACRYLSEKLLEAWEIAEEKQFPFSAQAERPPKAVSTDFNRVNVSSAETFSEPEIQYDAATPDDADDNTRTDSDDAATEQNTRMNSVLTALCANFPPARKTDNITEPDDQPKLFLPYAEPVALRAGARALPHNRDERALEARRLVADRCIYGVDSDPLAIEMAQLSLWLTTMAYERPFSFLEHALRVGDSLVGVDLDQLRTQSLDRLEGGSERRVGFSLAVNKARTAREMIHDLGEDETAKRAQTEEAQRLVAELQLMADSIIAPALSPAKGAAREEKRRSYWSRARSVAAWMPEHERELRVDIAADLNGVQPFHWPLEFPDAFFRDSMASEREAQGAPQNGGFDAIIGNPPFMGGQRITGNLGAPYRDYLIESLARDKKGSADLVAYFYLRAFDLIRRGGTFGLIATNTIAQGDTREVGLDQIAPLRSATTLAPLAFHSPTGAANSPTAASNPSTEELNSSTGASNSSTGASSSSTEASNSLTAELSSSTVELSSSMGASSSSTGEQITPMNSDVAAVAPLTATSNAYEARGTIYAANPSQKWPGTASLEVALVHVVKGAWRAAFDLAGQSVSGITPYLAEPGAVVGNPHRLAANAGKSFKGHNVYGMGFVMEPDAARALIARDARNAAVLQPYLNGEDLNSRPDSSPSRWVINFRDWPLDRQSAPADYEGPVAADYPDCLEIVEKLVKPERQEQNRKARADRWWIYGDYAKGMEQSISQLPRILIRPQVSRTHAPIFVNTDIVFSSMCIIFCIKETWSFSVLQSNVHETWVNELSSSLKSDQRYTPSDCFETFAFPVLTGTQRAELESLGGEYGALRRSICAARGLGLTKVYNLFHDAATSPASDVAASGEWADIVQLRALHVALDGAVARAYGWEDLVLGHDFHATAQGARFTLCEAARREVLDRLLALNHARFAAEVAAGLHEKKGKSKKPSKKKGAQMGLEL